MRNHKEAWKQYKETALANDISRELFTMRILNGYTPERAATRPKNRRLDKMIWAMYKGEDYLCDGTLEEISEFTGKKIGYLKHMVTPAYEKRTADKPNCLRLVDITD